MVKPHVVVGQVVRLGASLRATVLVDILGENDELIRASATIDTGFTDDLTLPAGVISDLDLIQIETVEVELGSGDLQLFKTYEATIVWQGQFRVVRVHESEGLPLIGMGLLQGNDIRIQAVQGGDVSISPMA